MRTANRSPISTRRSITSRRTCRRLGIDGARVGICASSGHAPLALSALMRRRELKCAALLYPYTLDLDGGTGVADAAKMFRFVNPATGKTVEDLPAGTPLFIAKAGKTRCLG